MTTATMMMMMMMMMVEKYQNLNRELMQICGVLSLLSLMNWYIGANFSKETRTRLG